MPSFTQPIYPVVLCGGAGTRLWPLSTDKAPKQFLRLFSDRSLFQETLLRLSGFSGLSCQPPIIVGNGEQHVLIEQHLQQISCQPYQTLLEPMGRNTAPAITSAACLLAGQAPDAWMLVLSADHQIQQPQAFQQAVCQAVELAQTHAQAQEEGLSAPFVLFGITPTSPKTGYGYMEKGAPLGISNGYRLKRFVEKPNLETAQSFLDSGSYVWNSGMFLLPVKGFLAAVKQRCPTLLEACQRAVQNGRRQSGALWLDADAYQVCPTVSVDVAIMEQYSPLFMVEAEMGWSDVGSWQAVWELSPKDAYGNVVISAQSPSKNAYLAETTNCYVQANTTQAGKKLALLGVENLVVVETDDALMICHQQHDQSVKAAQQALTKETVMNTQSLGCFGP